MDLQGLAIVVRRHWRPWCAGLVGLGCILHVSARWADHERLAYAGLFLFCYGSILGLAQLPNTPLGRGFDARLDRWMASRGTGFLGMVVFARFVQLELDSLLDALFEAGSVGDAAAGMFWEWLIGFSIDSLINSIQAVIWPYRGLGEYGLWPMAMLLAPLWLVYALGSRAFPALHRRLDKRVDATQATPPPPPAG